MSNPRLVLKYSYPGLWLGAVALGALGVMPIFMAIQVLLIPLPAGPGKPIDAAALAGVLFVFGGTFCLFAVLLGWLAWRMSERFEITDQRITWYKRGKPLTDLYWNELEHIQLDATSTELILEGPMGTRPLVINQSYTGFEKFLRFLKKNVDWEHLVRSPSRFPTSESRNLAMASNPGGFRLSLDRLHRLDPGTNDEAVRMLQRHLYGGDTRAACVVSTNPLVVAAYTDELDCVALLRFPQWLADEYNLRPESRLITSNTYFRGVSAARDLQPGPKNTRNWANFRPVIADFVSEESEKIANRKAAISRKEWSRCYQMGLIAWEHRNDCRSGTPPLSTDQPSGAPSPLRERNTDPETTSAQPSDQGPSKQPVELPVSHSKRGGFYAGVVGLALVFALTAGIWLIRPPAANPAGRAAADAKRDLAAFNFMKFFCLPLLCVLGTTGLLGMRLEVRVQNDGIVVQHVLRTQSYEWSDIRSADVVLTSIVVNNVKRYFHSLSVTPGEGKAILIPVGDEAFRWRDAILIAARHAGVSLKSSDAETQLLND